jgi:hypothetical protein
MMEGKMVSFDKKTFSLGIVPERIEQEQTAIFHVNHPKNEN